MAVSTSEWMHSENIAELLVDRAAMPVAGAIFTVGMRVGRGGGSVGCAPVPAATGSVAMSPQVVRASAAAPTDGARHRQRARKPESGFLNYGWEGYSEALLLYRLGLGSPSHPLTEARFPAWTGTYQWENLYGIDVLYAEPLATVLAPSCRAGNPTTWPPRGGTR